MKENLSITSLLCDSEKGTKSVYQSLESDSKCVMISYLIG